MTFKKSNFTTVKKGRNWTTLMYKSINGTPLGRCWDKLLLMTLCNIFKTEMKFYPNPNNFKFTYIHGYHTVFGALLKSRNLMIAFFYANSE